jgi:hypothetical protein
MYKAHLISKDRVRGSFIIVTTLGRDLDIVLNQFFRENILLYLFRGQVFFKNLSFCMKSERYLRHMEWEGIGLYLCVSQHQLDERSYTGFILDSTFRGSQVLFSTQCMCGCVDVCMCGCVDVWLRGCVDAWMCACVDVCMCACVDVWMCGCVHVCMCACVDVWMCACVDVCMCGCVDVWMCACVDVWMCACVDVWMCGCVHVWMCGCVDVWVCGCVDVWMCG